MGMLPELNEIAYFLDIETNIATAGQPLEDELKAIAKAGFEVVINLGLADAPYALPGEAALVKKLGMQYIHIPVVWGQPKMEDLDVFLKAMKRHRGQKIFVHCAANKRAGIFVALYRILEEKLETDTVLRDVYKIWRPNRVWWDFYRNALASRCRN